MGCKQVTGSMIGLVLLSHSHVLVLSGDEMIDEDEHRSLYLVCLHSTATLRIFVLSLLLLILPCRFEHDI